MRTPQANPTPPPRWRGKLPVPHYLLVWLALQALAVALAAFRVPLWLHAPQVGEGLALEILLSIQVVFAALLFPVLSESWEQTVAMMVTAWPFALLAGFLANRSSSTAIAGEAFVSGWIAALAIWNLPLSSTKAKMAGVSVAATWSAAGPLLLFLGSEYAALPPNPPAGAERLFFGPLISTYDVLSSAPAGRAWQPWLLLVAVAGAAGIALLGGPVIRLLRQAMRSR